jgi:hypothetical protein
VATRRAENLAVRTQHETKPKDNMKPATIAQMDFGKKKVRRNGRIADAGRTMVRQGVSIRMTFQDRGGTGGGIRSF